MTRLVLLAFAAAAGAAEIEPLTSGQKTALGWSDTRPRAEKAAHLHKLQREAVALGREAGPLLDRLAALAPRYPAGTAAVETERRALRAAAHDLRRRALLLDEEYSIMRRAYEFDRGLALVSGSLQDKKDVPDQDLADIAALNRFHDGLRRLVRRLPEAVQRDEAAYRAALEEERRRARARLLARAAAAAALALGLLFALWRLRLTKA